MALENDYEDWIFDRQVEIKFDDLLQTVRDFISKKLEQDLFLENSEYYNGKIKEFQLISSYGLIEIKGIYEDTSHYPAIVARIEFIQLTDTQARLQFQEDFRESNKRTFQRELGQFITDNVL